MSAMAIYQQLGSRKLTLSAIFFVVRDRTNVRYSATRQQLACA
jgi:hypothetical protein